MKTTPDQQKTWVSALIVLIVLSLWTLWKTPDILALANFACTVITIVIMPDKKRTASVALFTLFIGSLFEFTSVSMGIWSFATPQVSGVPLWLPLMYVNIVLFLRSYFLLYEKTELISKK